MNVRGSRPAGSTRAGVLRGLLFGPFPACLAPRTTGFTVFDDEEEGTGGLPSQARRAQGQIGFASGAKHHYSPGAVVFCEGAPQA